MLLKKKKALITGASEGLGKEIAKGFLREGADLFICSRSYKKLYNTYLELDKLKSKEQKIFFRATDISQPKEIDLLLKEFFKEFKNIDVLVNNAGILGPKGSFETLDWEEWQYAFDTNFKGSIYLVFKLIKKFKLQKEGSIIQISGGGATSPFPYMTAYASSKAAIVRFIESIAEELLPYNVTANSISPGALDTKMQKEVLKAGPNAVGEKYYNKIEKFKEEGFSPFYKAVNLAIELACRKKFPKITGKLLSAIWDEWIDLENYQENIIASDLYTLRRVDKKKT